MKPALAFSFALFTGFAACGGKTGTSPSDGGTPDGAYTGGDAGHDSGFMGDDGGTGEGGSEAGPTCSSSPPSTSKVDLLFVVQNSPSMAGVGPYLQGSVQSLLDRLIDPHCVDASGNVVGVSSNGACATGKLEYQPVYDIHVGIVTSSLGGRGGDQCPDAATNPANPSLGAHDDDQGHLINRSGSGETPLADASPSNFLGWYPAVEQKCGQPPPVVDPAIGTESQLLADFQGILADTGSHGCGFTLPLEAMYRFLVQPDPYESVTKNGTEAAYSGVDATLLQQRHDFLRPDSSVAIVLVENENEKGFDPLTIGAQGWAFSSAAFPGSPDGASPEGTTACQTTPESSSCTSCAFETGQADFATICPADPPGGTNGYLDPGDDGLNVRFFHMKQRFGLDAQFPVGRYVTGLSSTTVPDSLHEHDTSGDYAPVLNCTSPLFAASLPTSASQELCALPPGTRAPGQVVLAVLGGVPHQLLQQNPSDPDSPQKPTLSSSDWNAILGADPLNYDFTGADFHMLESEAARAQSTCPPTSSDTCDPINGREVATSKLDLQWACTYPLAAPVDCSQPATAGACACATGALEASTPLCEKDASGNYTQTQINGQAYPAIRALSVARSLGAQAVVGSLCPIHTTETTPGSDPLYGYRPALQALVDRLAPTLLP
jgi:hypothetical protein